MSIRRGLMYRLGGSFLVLWLVSAAWMFSDLQKNIDRTLDERLAASAKLVVSMLGASSLSAVDDGMRSSGLLPDEDVNLTAGMACQVSSLKGEILVRSHNSPSERIGRMGEGYHTQIADGVEWRTFTLEADGVRISTADRIEQRARLKYAILEAAAVPVLVALIGGLVVLWICVGKGLAPLARMSRALLSRNAEHLDPLNVDELPVELRPLAASQNELLLRLSRAIERERRFTGDAAHELRSPLTAIKTHIQVARLTDGDVSRVALGKAEKGADRLHCILEQLLLLARVEGRLSFDDGVQAFPSEIIMQALEDSERSNIVKIKLHQDADRYPLAVPSALATAALRNLIDNALRHTAPGTEVGLSVSVEGSMVLFCVQDKGGGIPELQLNDVTRRFWHQGRAGGTGLGLAIVEAIVARFNGELKLRNSAEGLEAVMSLPLVP